MKAVINSSPLISLALLGHLELLPKIYDEIIVPKSVYHEIAIKGKGKIGSEKLDNIAHFSIAQANNKMLMEAIMLELDEGEAEVITLAMEKKYRTLSLMNLLADNTLRFLA